MADEIGLPRRVIVLGIVLPFAALVGYLLGYLLVSPDYASVALLFVFGMLLLTPVFLRWHHPMLVFCWNFPMVVIFLPGSPPVWMVLALISFTITVLGVLLDKNQKMLQVPTLTWAMLAWVLVVFFTIKMTSGGFGLSSLGGSTHGGKKYFYILFTVLAFFALSSRRVPVKQANAYVQVFVLSSLATAPWAWSVWPTAWDRPFGDSTIFFPSTSP